MKKSVSTPQDAGARFELGLIHIVRSDPTKQSCLRRVCIGGVNWILDNLRLSPAENWKSETLIGIVRSHHHARHDTDRTVLSCLVGDVNWALGHNSITSIYCGFIKLLVVQQIHNKST